MSEKDKRIFLLQENWTESAARDLFSVACAFLTIGPGIWLESAAMQWVGFLMLGIVIMARAAGLRDKHSMTLDQAKEQIDTMLAEREAGK